jgi:hypothetical protein
VNFETLAKRLSLARCGRLLAEVNSCCSACPAAPTGKLSRPSGNDPYARKKADVPQRSDKHWTRSAGQGVSPTFRRRASCRPGDPPPLVPVLDRKPRSLALAPLRFAKRLTVGPSQTSMFPRFAELPAGQMWAGFLGRGRGSCADSRVETLLNREEASALSRQWPGTRSPSSDSVASMT